MADTNTEAPQSTKPVESVPEEKEETKSEGATEATKNVTTAAGNPSASNVPDSVFSMFGGGSKPKREEKEEEDGVPKGKAKKEDDVSSHRVLALEYEKELWANQVPKIGGGSPRVP